MTYQQATNRLHGRCKDSRKLGNHTYLIQRGTHITVRLYGTDILAFYPDGTIHISTGGWNTVTTRARINEYLPSPWGVGMDSKKFGDRLMLYLMGEPVALADGFTIPPDHKIPASACRELEKVREATRESLNARNRERTRAQYWIRKARTHEPAHKPLTLEQIQAESNVSIRTAMITVYGLERFLTQIKAQVIDSFNNYQLLSYGLNNWQSIRALKMVCPSTQTVYIHPVEPRCETVAKALDWMFQTENYLERLQAEA